MTKKKENNNKRKFVQKVLQIEKEEVKKIGTKTV